MNVMKTELHVTFRSISEHSNWAKKGVDGNGEGVVYLTSPGRPNEICLQLVKAAHDPCSR